MQTGLARLTWDHACPPSADMLFRAASRIGDHVCLPARHRDRGTKAVSDCIRGRPLLRKGGPAAQVLLQETVWREAEVDAHVCNRRKLLAALHPEPAAAPEAVFCWETVLKVCRRCPFLQGGMLQVHYCWLLQGTLRNAGAAPVISRRSSPQRLPQTIVPCCRVALSHRPLGRALWLEGLLRPSFDWQHGAQNELSGANYCRRCSAASHGNLARDCHLAVRQCGACAGVPLDFLSGAPSRWAPASACASATCLPPSMGEPSG